MKLPPTPPPALQALLSQQDGAMTASQALTAGLTRRQLRTLVASGWKRPFHGIYVAPNVVDEFRTNLRAALLACPLAAAYAATSARLHQLWGLPVWCADEEPVLILPDGHTFNHRRGLRLHARLREEEREVVKGYPASNIDRTLHRLALDLKPDDLVCAVDSAIRLGWAPVQGSARGRRRLHQAVALSDPRSESALETHGRLLLVRAGLAPEALQYEMFDESGHAYGRFDMAWPSVRLAIEFDGREYHDDADARRRDRFKANAAAAERWRLFRFTWFDVFQRPERIRAIVRGALLGG